MTTLISKCQQNWKRQQQQQNPNAHKTRQTTAFYDQIIEYNETCEYMYMY
jgi:hypothetical protein